LGVAAADPDAAAAPLDAFGNRRRAVGPSRFAAAAASGRPLPAAVDPEPGEVASPPLPAAVGPVSRPFPAAAWFAPRAPLRPLPAAGAGRGGRSDARSAPAPFPVARTGDTSVRAASSFDAACWPVVTPARSSDSSGELVVSFTR
jgi:hypothetical protein